jgi:hypothetical protein
MRPDQTDQEHKQSKTRPDGWTPDAAHQHGDGDGDGDAQLRERGKAIPMVSAGVSAGSWQDIKSRFVDDPAGAIAAAEQLVQRTVDDKVRTLKDEAAALCARARDDGEQSTENLRARLLSCQAYCERLTSRSQ